MSRGRYTATFKFTAEGVGLDAPVTVARPGQNIELSVADENAYEFRVKIVLEKVTQPEGDVTARTLAEDLYEQVVQRLSDHVECAKPPTRDAFEFQSDDATPIARGLSTGTSVVIGVGRAMLGSALFTPCLDAALDAQTARATVAPMVATARRMYRIAMETPDAVTSFLTCYSALTLAALHKGSGGQASVDRLLLGVDSTLPQSTYVDARRRARQETRYTEIRNRFVHAEERGNDPKAAAEDMKRHVRAFRSLTARALANL